MKQRILLSFVAVVFAISPAVLAGDAAPKVSIAQSSGVQKLLRSNTPTPLDYAITVENPSSDPITLRMVQLRTLGEGSYVLESGMRKIGEVIPANSTRTINVTVWGRATSYARENAPVTLRGVAYFDTSTGRRNRIFTQYIVRPAADF